MPKKKAGPLFAGYRYQTLAAVSDKLTLAAYRKLQAGDEVDVPPAICKKYPQIFADYVRPDKMAKKRQAQGEAAPEAVDAAPADPVAEPESEETQ